MLTINDKFRAELQEKFVTKTDEPVEQEPSRETKNWYGGFAGNGSVYSNTGPVPIINGVYNGEKNAGALGNPMNLFPDYRALRFRAYEASLTNPIIKIITSKFFKWVVGNGLKLQSEPLERLLNLEKVKENFTDFTQNVEEYWDRWVKSKQSDFSGMGSAHQNAQNNFSGKFIGGDVLTIVRVDKKTYNVTTQIIDGQHINTPTLENSFMQGATDRGNVIIDGVEIDKSGKHIAFYVKKSAINSKDTTGLIGNIPSYERIEAYEPKTGCLMAWMSYGIKHRIDHVRGIPEISAILEPVTVLERYTNATVATAEQRASVVHVLQHGKTSTGESHLVTNIRQRNGIDGLDGGLLGEAAAKQIAITENIQVHNLPVDSELKTVASNSEINYDPFFRSMFVQFCAAADIPPEVAMQQYNSNYSASRAAINAWGYIVDIHRKRLVEDFYQPVYNVWLYVHILKNKVEANGYIEAKEKGNMDVVEAYSNAKFTGINMPHIDPVKEMNAIRLAMGTDAANVPLISHEQATEAAGFGDWASNVKKLAEEQKTVDSLGIVPEPEPEQTSGTTAPKKKS
jgi:capsid protein